LQTWFNNLSNKGRKGTSMHPIRAGNKRNGSLLALVLMMVMAVAVAVVVAIVVGGNDGGRTSDNS
jgi:hypothetical protein